MERHVESDSAEEGLAGGRKYCTVLYSRDKRICNLFKVELNINQLSLAANINEHVIVGRRSRSFTRNDSIKFPWPPRFAVQFQEFPSFLRPPPRRLAISLLLDGHCACPRRQRQRSHDLTLSRSSEIGPVSPYSHPAHSDSLYQVHICILQNNYSSRLGMD